MFLEEQPCGAQAQLGADRGGGRGHYVRLDDVLKGRAMLQPGEGLTGDALAAKIRRMARAAGAVRYE